MMTPHTLNFAEINAAALRLYPGLLCQWFPGGVLHGDEYDVLNPSRVDRTKGSFRINTVTGAWADFATDQRGTTPITLYANFFTDTCNCREAAEHIARQLGMIQDAPADPMIARLVEALKSSSPKKEESLEAGWTQIPVADDAPLPPLPENAPAWTYFTASGQVLGYVSRINTAKGGKWFLPTTYWQNTAGQRAWKHKQFVRPLPIYNRPALDHAPDDWPVLVVEGEKTADAGQQWFEKTVVVSWPQGSSSAAYVDWSPLTGRTVLLLPDCDEPGRKAMRIIAEKLADKAAGVWWVDVEPDRPAGWDVADGTWETVAEATAWLDGLPHTQLSSSGRAPVAAPPLTPRGERVDAALDKANGKGPVYVPHIQAPIPAEPLPIPLLAQLEADLNRRVHIAHPLAAQQAALAVAAHACARQGLSTSNDPCCLSLAMCTQSVGLLRPYLAEVAKIFEAAGLKHSVRQTRISTTNGLYKLLYTQPALLYLSSEYGAMVQFARRQTAGSVEQALNTIAELYDAADLSLDLNDLGIKGFGDDQDVLRSPTLNLLTLISYEQMAAVAKASELGRGALEQIQSMLIDADRLVFNDPENIFTAPFDPALIAMIRRLRRIDGQSLLAVNHGYQRPELTTVRWGADMKTVYPALNELADSSSRTARPLLIAARSHIRRVSTVLAMWANPDAPIITPELLAWAARREIARMQGFLAQFNLLASDDGKTSVCQKVLAAISEATHHGMTLRALQQQCWAFRSLSKDKRDECLQTLIDDGDVIGLTPDGKRATTYYGSAFVKVQGAAP